MMGIAKFLVEWDDAALAQGRAAACSIIDFIEAHTSGFDAFVAAVRAADWDDDRARSRDWPRPSSSNRADLRQVQGGDGDLRHGPDAARQGRRERPHGRQSAADARQYRQARRGADAGARAFERARVSVPSASPRKPNSSRSTSWRSNMASPRRARKGSTRSRACRGVIDGSVKAFVALGGNFLRAVPETGGDGGSLAAARPVGADRDQAQPQSPVSGQGHLSAALPRPDRTRRPGERSASRVGRGFDQLHPRLARQGDAGERASAVGARDRRGHRQADPAAQPQASIGTLGSAIMR